MHPIVRLLLEIVLHGNLFLAKNGFFVNRPKIVPVLVQHEKRPQYTTKSDSGFVGTAVAAG